MRSGERFARLVNAVTRRPLLVLGVTMVLALGGAALALRLEPSAATDTLVDRGSNTFQDTERFKHDFGDEAVVVLVRGNLQKTVLTSDLGRVLGLEGCLSGNAPNTKQGRAALKRWIEETPAAPTPDRNPLLLKIFLGEHASAEVLLEQVRARRVEMERLKDELDAIDEQACGGSHDFFPQLTRMYGRRYAEAIIGWADDVERKLGARRER